MLIEKEYPLTLSQYNIWVDQQLNISSSMYNIGGQVNIKGDIKNNVFKEAINTLIKNNDALRTIFKSNIDGTPYQFFKEYEYYQLPYLDFSLEDDSYSKANSWMVEDFKIPFCLDSKQLFKFTLIKVEDNHYIYYGKFHHLIIDGWGVSLNVEQVREEYNSIINNTDTGNKKKYSYIKFIENDFDYKNSERFKKAKAYWSEKFNTKPDSILSNPVFNTPELIHGKSVRKSIYIKAEDYLELTRIGKVNNATIPNVLLGILFIYLNKILNQNNIVVGMPLLNRCSKSFKKTIGLFTETSPLLVNIDRNDSISDLIFKIKSALGECYRHQRFPVTEIEKLAKTNHFNRLFDVVFSYEVNSYDENFLNYETVTIPMPCQNQNNALTIHVMESKIGEDVLVNFDYRPDVFNTFTIENFTEQFQTLYKSLIKNPGSSIKDLEIISETCKNEILFDRNNNCIDFQTDKKTIIEQFEDQVEKTPNSIAVVFEGIELSYKKLNEKANVVGHYLKNNFDAKEDCIIGLMLPRSEKMIIAILGILKSGAAYVPIDPEYPKERIDYIISDSKPQVIISEENIDVILNSNESIHNTENVCNGSSLLYVIYTSGTTGLPKGTLITNDNYSNYINWAKSYYFEGDSTGNFGLFTSLSFDLTTTSIYLTLLRGKLLTVFNQNRDISSVLGEIFSSLMIDSVKLTPSHILLLRETGVSKSNISLSIVGGEELLTEHIKILRNINKNIQIENEYGPTETTVGSIVKQIGNISEKIVIGRPISNTKVYVLDGDLKPLPTGVPGEVFIGGLGVGLGYLNKPELTEKRFISNPFIAGEKVYKTGDVGRWLDSGDLDYLGRIDNQVKIKGYRIELGEIENRLLQFEGITSSVVLIHNNKGEKFLAAYYVSDIDIKLSDLRNFLGKSLPDYMIPAYFVLIDGIPLTPNGKLDRNALPDPLRNAISSSIRYIAPENELEKTLIDIWTKVLDIKQIIGIDDNFFELGGDSIKAIQVVSRLKQKGFVGQVSDLFDALTVRKFAKTISRNLNELDQSLISGIIPLTPIQKWFFYDLDCPKHHYNQSVILKIKEPFIKSNFNAIKMSIEKILEHHDALRMTFKMNNGIYVQENRELADLYFKEFDLRGEEKPLKKLKKIADEIQSSFNLENDTLIRFVYFNLNDGARLLIVAHHLIIDGVSWRILLEDLEYGYKQSLIGNRIDFPLKTTSYKKWSEKLISNTKSSEFHNVSSFWNSINFNCDDINYGERSDAQRTIRLKKSLTNEETIYLLTKSKQELNAGINEILLTALVKVLSKLNKQKYVLVDLESHGRSERFKDIDLSRTIGWFTSIFPVLLDIRECFGLEEEITSIKDTLLEIPDYGVGYGNLKYNTNMLKQKNSAKILFNYLGQFDSDTSTELFELATEEIGVSTSPAANNPYNLIFNGMVSGGKFSISLESSIYTKKIIEELLNSYLIEIRQILAYSASQNNEKNKMNNIKNTSIENRTQRIRI